MTDYLISNPEAAWTIEIPEIAVGDPVLGGTEGPVNVPHQALADRTEYLKTQLEGHNADPNAQ